MKVRILGVRGYIQPTAPRYARHSGVLIDSTLLLDCGEDEYLKLSPSAILISHLHPDHAFFVARKAKIDLGAPAFAPEPFAPANVEPLRRAARFDRYRVIPIPTLHSHSVLSQAYLVENGDVRLLYTSDLVDMEQRYRRKIGQVDLLITEASFMRRGGLVRRNADGLLSGHAGINELIEMFKHHSDRILFMHFGSWFYKDIAGSRKKLQQLGTEYGIEVIVGYDGLEVAV